MQKEYYLALHRYVDTHSTLKRIVCHGVKLLPAMVYLLYPLEVLRTLLLDRIHLLYILLVPAAGFVICTVLRAGLNCPRPYEVLGIPAIVRKDTIGKSFPSRHAACASVIAITLLPIYPVSGGVLLLLSFLIVISRVLAGVHFIRDVLCGWLLGAIIGLLGAAVLL